MAKEKKQYKVLVDFEMGGKKFATGQEITLESEKTQALLDNGVIQPINLGGTASTGLNTPTTPFPSQPPVNPPQSLPEDYSKIFQALQAEIRELKENQGMFMATADKKLLAQYYAKNQKKMPKEFRLNLFNGKVIILRRDMPVNNVGKNPATKLWFEEQMVEMVLEGDEVIKTTYQASLAYTQAPAKLISTQIDEMTDEVICKLVRVDTGKEYNINLKYLN